MNSEPQSKPWFILGGGAMGCLWAYHGLAAGRDVTLILRCEERLEELRANGGISVIKQGVKHTLPCSAVLASDITAPIEQLLLCCKAHQSERAFVSVAELLADNCPVILLQNGMGVAEELLKVSPNLQLYGGVSTDGVHLLAPFTLQRAGYGLTRIGRLPREPGMIDSQKLCSQLDFPELTVEPCDDIYQVQWRKLAINAAINPLTALYNIRNGQVTEHPEASIALAPLCQEIALLSQTQDISWSAADIEKAIREVCHQTAANVSSMLQDIRNIRVTEIEYINGYLQQLADKNGLPMPTNRALLQAIRAINQPNHNPPGTGYNAAKP